MVGIALVRRCDQCRAQPTVGRWSRDCNVSRGRNDSVKESHKMSQQDDRTQQMIDEGLIFGPDKNEPPKADDPLVKALMQFMDECDGRCCDRTYKHVHVYPDEESNREEVYRLDE